MANSVDFKDDVIYHEASEFQQIRDNLGMYISGDGINAVINLIHEIVNNSLDELVHPECRQSKIVKGDTINIYINEAEKRIVVDDNGRGIPHDKIVDMSSKKHSSGKFGRSANPFAAGTHGVGVKITVALSDYASLESYRGEYSKLIEYHHGELDEHKKKKEKKEKYGTVVTFVPSEKYLGPIDMDSNVVEDWLRRLSYQYPADDIVINLLVDRKDGSKYDKAYKKHELSDNVLYLAVKPEYKPISLFNETSYEKKVKKDKDDMDEELMKLWVSFTHDKTVDKTLIDSYCNYIYTVNNGTHVDGVKNAISRFFMKAYKEKASKSDPEIIKDDIFTGMVLCVQCLHTTPILHGQTKDAVTNKEITTKADSLTYKQLTEYFKSNQQLLEKIVNLIKLNAKARLGSMKVKGVDIKKSNYLTDSEIPGYFPLANRNYNGYTELIITEGDSASGNIDKVRNRKNQAVLGIFGILNNVVDMDWKEVMTKDKIKALVNVLGCGIGPTFDITKCRWNKIIIMTDYDVDGHNITSFLCSFFVFHMPELVKAGMIYKAIPPLYLMDEKTRKKYKCEKYLYNKLEYFDLRHKIFADHIELLEESKDGGANKLTTKQVKNWLDINREYSVALDALQSYAIIDRFILETLTDLTLSYDLRKKDQREKYFKAAKKLLPELGDYDTDIMRVEGVHNGDVFAVIIDDLFFKNARNLIEVLSRNASLYVGYRKKGSNDEFRRMTIGQCLQEITNEYSFNTGQRFKGLGEMRAEIMFETGVNPLTRKLYRLTVSNWEDTLQGMRELHSKKEISARKEILQTFRATYDDLDS